MLEEGCSTLDLNADDTAGYFRVPGEIDVEVSSVVTSSADLVDDHAVTLQEASDRVNTGALGTMADAELLPCWRLRGSLGHERTIRPSDEELD
jgi:hypothetical protein